MAETMNQDIFEVVKSHLVGRGIDAARIVPDADLANDIGLDSLDTVELSLGLEKHFDVEIADEDLEDVRTVADAVDLVTGKVVARA